MCVVCVCVCVVVGCEGLGWCGVKWAYYVLHVQCVRLMEPFKNDILMNGPIGIDRALGARVSVRLYPGGPVFAIGRFCMVRTNQTVDIDTQFAFL
jgi:hypothetical protein